MAVASCSDLLGMALLCWKAWACRHPEWRHSTWETSQQRGVGIRRNSALDRWGPQNPCSKAGRVIHVHPMRRWDVVKKVEPVRWGRDKPAPQTAVAARWQQLFASCLLQKSGCFPSREHGIHGHAMKAKDLLSLLRPLVSQRAGPDVLRGAFREMDALRNLP